MGLSKSHPLVALALLIFMFSLAGIPPMAGFFGKLFIFTAALDAELYTLAVIGVIASVVGRITTHHEKGNDSISWNLNASYELFEDFFPLVEYHGHLYISNGSRLAARDGLLDYSNLGASDVRGSSAHWAEFGLRWNFIEHVSLGAAFGYGLRDNSNNDIFDRRVTTNLIFTY